MNKSTIKPQRSKKDEGMFIKAFKGTFGVLGAYYLFWFGILLVLSLFIFSIYRIYKIKECKQEHDETIRKTNNTDAKGNSKINKNKKTICKKDNELNEHDKAALYGWYTIAGITGLILLVVIIPYIIQFIGWMFGIIIYDSIF